MHDRRMYCLRCEDVGMCQARANTVGLMLPGWNLTLLGTSLVAIFLGLANRMVAEKSGSFWGDHNVPATVCVILAFLVLAAMVVILGTAARFLRARGDATTLTCAACNGTELVPENSTRFRREMKDRSK